MYKFCRFKSLNMDISKDFFDYIVQDNIQISYSGPFDSLILSILANNIENNISASPVVIKKLYKIFIELTQNITLYSLEREKDVNKKTEIGYGAIILKEFEDYFMLISGNVASKLDIDAIVNRNNTINSLSREQLREYKRQQRKLASSRKGGGNIGLIQVALTAENLLDFKTVYINDDEYYYLLSVKVNKSSTEELV